MRPGRAVRSDSGEIKGDTVNSAGKTSDMSACFDLFYDYENRVTHKGNCIRK